MPKYKKRSDGLYQTSVSSGYDNNGNRKRKYLYAKTIRELEEKVRDYREHGDEKKKIPTLIIYAEKWVNIYHPGKYDYHNIIKNHLHDLADKRIDLITRTDIQTAVNAEEGHYDIQRRLRMTLKQIYSSAIMDRIVEVSPVVDIKIGSKPKTNRTRLTEEQEDIVSNSTLKGIPFYFAQILYFTGIRRGECLALRKTDFDGKSVNIQRAVSFDGEEPVIKSTKTSSGIRSVPVPERLNEILGPLFAETDDFLFCRNGNLMTKTQVRRMTDKIQKEVGVTPHYFRHNYATKLYESGVDLKTAQYLLGHADTRMLLEIYSHPRIQEIDLDRIFENKGCKKVVRMLKNA